MNIDKICRVLLVIVTISFIASCSSLGSRVDNFSKGHQDANSYLVFRCAATGEGPVLNPYVTISNAYDMTQTFTYTAWGSGNEDPVVYSLKPGTYRISVGAQAKTNPISTLLIGAMSYSYNIYPLVFVFTVRNNEVLYLGDLLFDKKLHDNFDLEKMKADLAAKQLAVDSYDWKTLERSSSQ